MKNSTDLEVKVEKNKRTTKDVLAALTAFFGLMYIFLALIGYGVSLAFESIFNIPHSQLYESPFELIDLSSLAVVQLVFGATEIIDRSLPLLKNMYSRSYGLILFAVILSVAISAIIHLASAKQGRIKKFSVGKRISTSASSSFLLKASLIGSVAALLQPVLMLLLIMGFVFITFTLSSFTWVGLLAGKSYIQKWVIGSEDCPAAGVVVDTSRQDVEDFTCAIVVRDAKTVASGRVIWSTAKVMFLYTPSSNTAERVALDSAVVELRKIRPKKAS
jgi:hypothetical protein